MLRESFIEVIRKNFSTEKAHSLWSEIELAYSHPNRHYHNLTHLDHFYNETLNARHLINDFDVILVATAYHDIIYEVSRNDNEEKSALFMRGRFPFLLYSKLIKCEKLILATKTHQRSDDSDVNIFTDADLSILGAAPDAYRTYASNIRKEYSNVADPDYKNGRTTVLHRLLSMKEIFKTTHFKELYETQARMNIKAEIEELSL